MVFGDRNDVASTGVLEQLGPLSGVKLFGFELGNEILVAELFLRAVGLDVMLEEVVATPIAIDVHLPRIPFAAERRHAVSTPVDEDAELGVLVPLRDLVLLPVISTSARKGPGQSRIEFWPATVRQVDAAWSRLDPLEQIPDWHTTPPSSQQKNLWKPLLTPPEFMI